MGARRWRTSIGWTIAAAALGLNAAVVPQATATVDLTGRWAVTYDNVFGVFTPLEDWVQTGTALTVYPAGSSTPGSTGTIDPESGVFDLTGTSPVAPWCSLGTMHGVAAADSKTFSGSAVGYVLGSMLRCIAIPSQVTGSRCGNQQIDPDEQCDDGNTTSGGCCSSACQLEPSGSPCPDGNACTDDACDGNGTCVHTNNTGPCGSTCLPGSCSAGTCTLGAPTPADTPCTADATACTSDTCDGAGQCESEIRTTCQAASGKTSVTLRNASASGGSKVVWKWKDDTGTTAETDFGNPDATTDYTLCVFAGPTLLLEATAPAGGSCGAQACWHQTAYGFNYSDPGLSPNGIRRIRLNAPPQAPATILVKGNSDYLELTESLAVPSVSVQLVPTDEADDACWQATYSNPKVNTSTKFRATE